jgi:hypothetical protein
LQHALDGGRTTLNAENASACLKALTVGKEGCFPFMDLSKFAPECQDAKWYQGNQAAGKQCLLTGSDIECVANTYCAPNRECKALAGAGESCESAQCQEDLYCGPDETTGEPVCLSRKSAGTECTDTLSHADCQEDLICINSDESTTTPECTAKKAIGESCETDTVCQSEFCLPGTCDDGSDMICYGDNDCGVGTCASSGAACLTDGDCGGTCETSGYTCSTDDDCPGSCSVSLYTCYGSIDCTAGTCAVSGYTCYADYEDSYCNVLTDPADVCIQEDDCVSSESFILEDVCEGVSTCGGRVCAENYGTVDFCTLDPWGFAV